MKAWVVLASAFITALAVPGAAVAAPGDLDASFSGDGVAQTDLSSDRSGSDAAFGVAVDANGRIVAVGRTSGSGGRFALVRYHSDGTLDLAFGGDGKVRTNIRPGADVAFDVAVQDDGAIVVVGRAGVRGGALALARYEADGTLDQTFRGDGTVVTRFDDPAEATSVAIQPDGKIVVVGRAGADLLVARYRQDGRLDDMFRSGGTVRTDFGPGREVASAVSIDVDGAIVAAGTAGVRGSSVIDSMFAVARYDGDGRLDPTFGGDGTVEVELSSAGDIVHGVATDTTGRIVVVGTTGVGAIEPDTWSAVLRLDTNGTLDPTFSDDGVRVRNITNRPDVATDVAVQNDGKVVVSGSSIGPGRCCPSRGWVLRYQATGRPDLTFEGGEVVTDPADARATFAVAIQADGRIVVAGRADDDGSRVAVLRLLGA